MTIETSKIFSEIIIFTPSKFGDERGYFMESYNNNRFIDAIGRKVNFVQDNHSNSRKGVTESSPI